MLPVPQELLEKQQLLLRVGFLLRTDTWRSWLWNSSTTAAWTAEKVWTVSPTHGSESVSRTGWWQSLVVRNSSSAPMSWLTRGCHRNSTLDPSCSRKTYRAPLNSSISELGYILIVSFLANIFHPFRQIGFFFPHLSVILTLKNISSHSLHF